MSEAGGHGNRRHPRCETVWPACLLRKIIWLGPVQFGQSSYSSSVDQLRPPNWAFCDGGLPNSPDLNPREGGREGVPPLSLSGLRLIQLMAVAAFYLCSPFHCSLLHSSIASIGRARDANMQRAMPRQTKLPRAQIDPRGARVWESGALVYTRHETRRSFSLA